MPVGARRDRRSAWRELLRFLPDVGRLLMNLARDRRVPLLAKVVAVLGVLYVFSPIDVVPDVVPGVGRLDDLWVATRALRLLFTSAGYDVVHELWEGTDEGFALLLLVAGIER